MSDNQPDPSKDRWVPTTWPHIDPSSVGAAPSDRWAFVWPQFGARLEPPYAGSGEDYCTLTVTRYDRAMHHRHNKPLRVACDNNAPIVAAAKIALLMLPFDPQAVEELVRSCPVVAQHIRRSLTPHAEDLAATLQDLKDQIVACEKRSTVINALLEFASPGAEPAP